MLFISTNPRETLPVIAARSPHASTHTRALAYQRAGMAVKHRPAPSPHHQRHRALHQHSAAATSAQRHRCAPPRPTTPRRCTTTLTHCHLLPPPPLQPPLPPHPDPIARPTPNRYHRHPRCCTVCGVVIRCSVTVDTNAPGAGRVVKGNHQGRSRRTDAVTVTQPSLLLSKATLS